MILSVLPAVLAEHSVAKHISLIVFVAYTTHILLAAFSETVGIDERIIAGVVRRVDVYHFHLAEIAFLQHFQHLHILTLDEDILRIIEVHRLLTTRYKRRCRGLLHNAESVALASPIQPVAFVSKIHIFAQCSAQFFPIYLTLIENFGHNRLQYLDTFLFRCLRISFHNHIKTLHPI